MEGGRYFHVLIDWHFVSVLEKLSDGLQLIRKEKIIDNVLDMKDVPEYISLLVNALKKANDTVSNYDVVKTTIDFGFWLDEHLDGAVIEAFPAMWSTPHLRLYVPNIFDNLDRFLLHFPRLKRLDLRCIDLKGFTWSFLDTEAALKLEHLELDFDRSDRLRNLLHFDQIGESLQHRIIRYCSNTSLLPEGAARVVIFDRCELQHDFGENVIKAFSKCTRQVTINYKPNSDPSYWLRDCAKKARRKAKQPFARPYVRFLRKTYRAVITNDLDSAEHWLNYEVSFEEDRIPYDATPLDMISETSM